MRPATWVEKLARFDDPAGLVRDIECDEVEIDGLVMGRVSLTFTIDDFRRDSHEVQGKVFIPAQMRDDPTRRLPLIFCCGYPLSDENAPEQVRRGRVVATTVHPAEGTLFPHPWALLRGPNFEIVLGHLVRSLPCVDLTKVVYTGGSAGGYAALMASAEAFPVTVVAAGVPPVNLAAMYAGMRRNLPIGSLGQDATARQPAAVFASSWEPVMAAWSQVFGDDVDQPVWIEHSPIGHLDRITAPVASFLSITDVLVPIDQFDRDLSERMSRAGLGGLDFRAHVDEGKAVNRRLFDELGDRADVHVVPIPCGHQPIVEADLTLLKKMPPFALPDVTPSALEWFVTVVDEGDPALVHSHFKHALEPDFEPVIARCLEAGIGVDQLTVRKLEQLLDRWIGVEWISASFPHLDRLAAERADVTRGLVAYCGCSPAHARRFAELYATVDSDRQLLPAAVLARLG